MYIQPPSLIAWHALGPGGDQTGLSAPCRAALLSLDQALGHPGMSVLNRLYSVVWCPIL